MDYNPPPLFKQGASANVRLFFFVVLAICLIAVDSRAKLLEPLRQGVATMVYPIQRVLMMPRDVSANLFEYFSFQSELVSENKALKLQASQSANQTSRAAQLQEENQQLRKLMALREKAPMQYLAADLLYETRDPSNRKIVIDRGSVHDMRGGMPVVDDVGLIGQIIRVFPLTSEANLITDRDQATPVQVARNGLRAVAYGGAEGGLLEIRFMASNADINVGDELFTSGIDGVYPAGLPVAKVISIDKAATGGFAKILCKPSAGVSAHRHVNVLTSSLVLPERPPEAVEVGKRLKKR